MFLYVISNSMNDKRYIGISVRPNYRFTDHKRADSVIGRAIRKYGKEKFKLTVLVEGSDEYISELEPKAIMTFGTLVPNGYNLSLQTQTSFKHHELSKIKMRKPKSAIARTNMSLAKKGKPNGRKGIFKHTDETKSKIRNTLTGVSKSQDFKDKLTGRTLSAEHIENISRGNKGKKQSIVTCPHCQKQGGSQTMPRWHFDRCKFKEL